MPRYLTVEQVKAYCRNELPTEDDEWFEAACDAAETALDQSCQRQFVVAGTTATTRLYRPDPRSSVLRVHDIANTTDLVVVEDGTTLLSSDYQLEPVNGLTWAGEQRPYEQIRLLDGHWWEIDYDRATISVTARWGWSAIPARIEQAALIIAKEIITNRDEVKLGLIGFSDVGGVVARTNPIVRETVAHYRRVESWGIA
jgi:hypothetical protein